MASQPMADPFANALIEQLNQLGENIGAIVQARQERKDRQFFFDTWKRSQEKQNEYNTQQSLWEQAQQQGLGGQEGGEQKQGEEPVGPRMPSTGQPTGGPGDGTWNTWQSMLDAKPETAVAGPKIPGEPNQGVSATSNPAGQTPAMRPPPPYDRDKWIVDQMMPYLAKQSRASSISRAFMAGQVSNLLKQMDPAYQQQQEQRQLQMQRTQQGIETEEARREMWKSKQIAIKEKEAEAKETKKELEHKALIEFINKHRNTEPDQHNQLDPLNLQEARRRAKALGMELQEKETPIGNKGDYNLTYELVEPKPAGEKAEVTLPLKLQASMDKADTMKAGIEALEALPAEVLDQIKKLPPEIAKQFTKAMYRGFSVEEILEALKAEGHLK